MSERLMGRLAEVARFGAVGAVAFVVNVTVFNIALVALQLNTLLARSLAVAIATLVAYVGSRYWTFASRRHTSGHHGSGSGGGSELVSGQAAAGDGAAGRRQQVAGSSGGAGREFVTFVLVNLAGLGVELIPLWISHYLMGFTSVWADNLAGSIIGTGLGTIFRYFAYRQVVFTGTGAKTGTGANASAKAGRGADAPQLP